MSRLPIGGALLAVALAVGPSRCSADEVDTLMARLFDPEREDRDAVVELRALGAHARRGLERWIDPDGAVDRGDGPPRGADVGELVRRLGDGRYAVRELATRELVGLGLSAIRHVRAAVQDADAERRQRAAWILAVISPPPSSDHPYAPIQTALLLGWIGDRRSLPALRHVLDDPVPAVAAAADCALRMILGIGPPAMPLAWRTRPAALRAAWDAVLEADVLGTPLVADLSPTCRLAPLGDHAGRCAVTRSHHEWDVVPNAAVEWDGEPRVWREDCEETYRFGTEGPMERRFERRIEAQRRDLYVDAESGARRRAGLDLTGRSIAIEVSPDGDLVSPRFPCLRGAAPAEPLLAPGELLMAVVPPRPLVLGASAPVAEEVVQRVGAMMMGVYGRRLVSEHSLFDATGRMRYLGRVGDRDRVHVAFHWVGHRDCGSWCELVLHGELAIDPHSGLLIAHALSGPMWHFGPLPLSRDEWAPPAWFGEQRFEAVLRAPTSSPEVERLWGRLW